MGKKSRTKAANQATSRKEAAEANKQKEIQKLVSELLEKCSKSPEPGCVNWTEFVTIHDLTQRIMALQKGSEWKCEGGSRGKNFQKFMRWIEDQGVDTSHVKIVEEEPGNYGLGAKTEIQEKELFLSVPRKCMLSTETALTSHGLGTLAKEDKLLQNMPNVLLALHLLSERKNPDSFWQPYIRILPPDFTTVLYYTLEDMKLLKGSPAQYDAVMLYRNIARQFCYFHKIFRVFPKLAETIVGPTFTFSDYRWAVSAVMTRQNLVPSGAPSSPDAPHEAPPGGPMVTALIPLWDMANHSEGHISTDYSVEEECSQCYSLRHYKPGETIHIFYGPRSNTEFLVHSGFVYDGNLHDYLAIKLGISKSDPLARLKMKILNECNIPCSQYFPLNRTDNPVSRELLAFLRVFCMTEDELRSRDQEAVDDYDEWLLSIKEEDTPISLENEMKAWSYLETRTALLLKSYPTTLEEDVKMLSDASRRPHERIITQLLVQEKRILARAAEFSSVRKQRLADCQGPLPGQEPLLCQEPLPHQEPLLCQGPLPHQEPLLCQEPLPHQEPLSNSADSPSEESSTDVEVPPCPESFTNLEVPPCQ